MTCTRTVPPVWLLLFTSSTQPRASYGESMIGWPEASAGPAGPDLEHETVGVAVGRSRCRALTGLEVAGQQGEVAHFLGGHRTTAANPGWPLAECRRSTSGSSFHRGAALTAVVHSHRFHRLPGLGELGASDRDVVGR